MWFRKKLQNLSVVFIGQSSSYARLSVGAVVVNFLQLDTDNKKATAFDSLSQVCRMA